MIHTTYHGLHVQMGTGDVLICTERYPENPSATIVSFREAPPRPIGALATPADIESAGPPRVKIEFTSRESLDSLITVLTALRAELVRPVAAGPLPSEMIQ